MSTNDAPRSGLIDLKPSVSVPEALLTDVAAEISEIEELQAMLAIFRIVDSQGGAEHPLAEESIERDRWLRRALRTEGSPNAPTERIAKGLSLAAGRGTLLRFITRAAPPVAWFPPLIRRRQGCDKGSPPASRCS